MSDSYVTYASWVSPTGRPGAIDDIADQFERRPAATAALDAPVELASRRPANGESEAAKLAG